MARHFPRHVPDSQSSEEGYGTRIGLYRLAVPLLYRYNVSRMAYRKFDVGLQAILEKVSAGSVLGGGRFVTRRCR